MNVDYISIMKSSRAVILLSQTFIFVKLLYKVLPLNLGHLLRNYWYMETTYTMLTIAIANHTIVADSDGENYNYNISIKDNILIFRAGNNNIEYKLYSAA